MTDVLTADLDFAEVAAAWQQMLDGSYPAAKRQIPSIAAGTRIWRDMPHFSNATEDQMREWLTDGYKVAGQALTGKNTRPRRRLRFSEDDGELQMERVYAGDDAIYLERKPRKRQRGISLKIEVGFRANVTGETLNAYAIWLGKLITGLEGGGFQTQIDIVSRSTNLKRSNPNQRVDIQMRVKRFGQRGSLRSWSALLSPGGHRHLIFCARILGCHKVGFGCNPGFGGSVHYGWDLKWDPTSRTLTVCCNSMAANFPAAEMDAKLAAIKF